MKRQFSVLACLVLVVVMVCSMASCSIISNFLPKDQHTHSYNEEGKCECGESDPDYVAPAPHEHNFVDGKCECGESDPNYVPPTTGTKDDPHAITIPGTLDIAFAGGFEPVWYSFTASETKTLSITLGSANADMGYGTDADAMQYTSGSINVEINVEAGVTYFFNFSTLNGEAEAYAVVSEYIVKVSPYEVVIHEGKGNTVTFTAEEIEAGTATRKLVIDTASSYQFAGDLFVASVVAADGTVIERDSNYAYTLAAGEYTLTFGMFSIFGIEADTGIDLNVEDQNAEDDGDEGDVTGESDFVIGDNSVTLTEEEASNGKNFTFVAQSAGTYTFSGLLAIVSNSDGMQIGRMEVILEAGTYTVTLVDIEGVGGDFTLTIAYTAPEGSGDGEGGEGDGSTEDNPTAITFPAENLAANGDSINFNWYIFTTTQPGIITITYANENGWARIYNVDDADDSNNAGEKQVMTFKVKAGCTYKLGLGVWNPEAGVTASVTFEYVEPSALADKGDIYVDDEATFDVTADDITAGGFTANLYSLYAGEYSITSGDLMVSSVVTEDGTVIARNDNWFYELEAYTTYIITFSTQYVSNAGSYSATVEYNYPEGHQKNPIWIFGLGDEIVANYKGDYEAVWYTFYPSANGVVTITTADTAATIMLMPVGGMEVTNYVDGEWTGSVSLTVMQGRQYLIGVIDSNWSAEARDIAFTPALTEGEYFGDGTQNTPNIAVDGSNTANVPAWDNTYFVYTAIANGVLTLTSDNELCSWAVATEFGNFEFVGGTLTIALEMDQKAYIAVSTSDGSAAEIAFNASFKADPVGSYFDGDVIFDGSAANAVTVADNTWVTLSFWGMGQYTITWDNADAVLAIADYMGNTVIENGGVITGSNWGNDIMVYFEGYAAGTVNVTITPYVEESTSNSLVIGDNTIEVQDTSMGDTYELPVNADETVTYVLTVGANGVIILSDGTVLTAEGSTTEITVPAGETVTVGIGALSWSDNVAVISVAVKEASTPDEGGDEPVDPTPADPNAGLAGSGTSSDPYVLVELPFTVTYAASHDKYYVYTATEACVITIVCPTGCLVSETGAYKNAEGNYVITLEAGATLRMNTWSNGGTAPYTYTISSAPVENVEEDGGDSGDSDVTSNTYLTSHANGRKMKVVVYSNGVLEIIRSDITGNFSGGASTATYSWEIVDGAFVVSGTGSATGIEFTAEGAPVKLYWLGVEYNNFELQA